MTNGEAPRRFQFSPQRERSGALRLLAARRHAKAAGVAPSCQQGATSNMWNLHRAGGSRGLWKRRGRAILFDFRKRPFQAPSHLPQPGFRPRARGDHRCAALPVGRDVERPASATDRGRRAFRRCGRPHLLGGVVVAVAVDRRAEPLTGEIIMDSKTWPCAVIAILMCAAGTMSQAQESGPPQPTPRDDPATSGAGPTSRAPGQFDYDPPKGASVTTDQRGHTTTNSTSGGSTPGNPRRDQGNDSIDAIAPKN